MIYGGHGRNAQLPAEKQPGRAKYLGLKELKFLQARGCKYVIRCECSGVQIIQDGVNHWDMSE